MRGLLLSLVRTACPLDVLMGISSAKGALQAQKQLCNTERTMNHLTMNVRTSALVGHQASAFVGQARTVAAPLKVRPEGSRRSHGIQLVTSSDRRAKHTSRPCMPRQIRSPVQAHQRFPRSGPLICQPLTRGHSRPTNCVSQQLSANAASVASSLTCRLGLQGNGGVWQRRPRHWLLVTRWYPLPARHCYRATVQH